jgi:hypothetical protein
MLVLLAAFASTSFGQQPGVFDLRFTIEYVAPAVETPANRAALEFALNEAENRWRSVITGYQPGVTIQGAEIHVELGLAPGVTGSSSTTGGLQTVQSGFAFHTNAAGNVSVGTTSLSLPYLEEGIQNGLGPVITTLTHEFGHNLAFNPNLLAWNNVFSPLNDGSGGVDESKYVGAAGLSAFQAEFAPSALFVPFGSVTGHWDYATSNPTDNFNRPLRDDIMVAPTTPNSFFSQTTVMALRDFGYTTRLPGDFNDDLDQDADDIDFYSLAIGLPASVDPILDFDQDGTITLTDHDYLIENLIPTPLGTGTLVGDINLDGVVNTLGDASILVGNLNSEGGYADGDLNADGIINVLGDAFILADALGQ